MELVSQETPCLILSVFWPTHQNDSCLLLLSFLLLLMLLHGCLRVCHCWGNRIGRCCPTVVKQWGNADTTQKVPKSLYLHKILENVDCWNSWSIPKRVQLSLSKLLNESYWWDHWHQPTTHLTRIRIKIIRILLQIIWILGRFLPYQPYTWLPGRFSCPTELLNATPIF